MKLLSIHSFVKHIWTVCHVHLKQYGRRSSSGQQQLGIDLQTSKRNKKLWEGVKTKGAHRQVLSTQRLQSVQNVQVLFTKTRGHEDGPVFIKDEEKIHNSSKGSECVCSLKGRPCIQRWKTRHTKTFAYC